MDVTTIEVEWILWFTLGSAILAVILLLVLFKEAAWHHEMEPCPGCGRNEWIKTDCPHIVECTRCHHRENIGLDDEEVDSKTE